MSRTRTPSRLHRLRPEHTERARRRKRQPPRPSGRGGVDASDPTTIRSGGDKNGGCVTRHEPPSRHKSRYVKRLAQPRRHGPDTRRPPARSGDVATARTPNWMARRVRLAARAPDSADAAGPGGEARASLAPPVRLRDVPLVLDRRGCRDRLTVMLRGPWPFAVPAVATGIVWIASTVGGG
jgi:hypothetical protein